MNMQIPEDVHAQLDASRGKLGSWLPTKYPQDQLLLWSVMWRQSTAIGRAVAAEEIALAEAAQEAARINAAHQQQLAEARQKIVDDQIQVEEQYRLPTGTEVMVSSSQTMLNGRLGTVMGMEFKAGKLMATVSIDPLPADHPMRKAEIRHRPLRFMPVTYECHASELQRPSILECHQESERPASSSNL